MIRRKIKFSHHYDVPFNQKEIVFVSYRHIDSDICNAVLEQLQTVTHVAVWVDEHLTAGEYYDDEIEEAMLLSDVMIQIVTEHYFSEGSYTMERELPLAKEIGVKVIAVLCGNTTEDITSHLYNNADYVCTFQDSNSIAIALDKIHKEIQHMDFIPKFLNLTKRINTWYLTPKDMFQLAQGYFQLHKSDKMNLIPPQLTEDTAKRYARAAAIVGIEGAEALLKKLEG